MRLRSARPLTKVQAGFVAGAAVTILVFVLKRYGNIELPPDVIAALTFLLTCAVAYVVPILPGELAVLPDDPIVFGNGGTVVAPELAVASHDTPNDLISEFAKRHDHQSRA